MSPYKIAWNGQHDANIVQGLQQQLLIYCNGYPIHRPVLSIGLVPPLLATAATAAQLLDVVSRPVNGSSCKTVFSTDRAHLYTVGLEL